MKIDMTLRLGLMYISNLVFMSAKTFVIQDVASLLFLVIFALNSWEDGFKCGGGVCTRKN
ncbi:hypothetical protein J2Z65_001093 [Paenibacillus aceris]|uniref:Uncharacterized protein n=1 Tax=Paenibacillus aceris TaxID=869555 RepID=A0ABS4HTP6_9BACL|nr:hypothetical protein [Paenibacillus aceris]